MTSGPSSRTVVPVIPSRGSARLFQRHRPGSTSEPCGTRRGRHTSTSRFSCRGLSTTGTNGYIRRDRFDPEYDELAAFLGQSERSDRGKLRAYQETRLREIIRHAYDTAPHYRDVMDERRLTPDDITSVGDIAKFPVLRKKDVRDAGARLS